MRNEASSILDVMQCSSKTLAGIRHVSLVLRLVVIAVFFSLLSGCGQKRPNITLEAMTLFGVPAALTIKNQGRQDIIIVAVKVDGARPLTTVLRFGAPNQDFHSTTLSQGEAISLDCPFQGPVNEVVVCTDQGDKTFDLRD